MRWFYFLLGFVVLAIGIGYVSGQANVGSSVTINTPSDNDFIVIYDEFRAGVDTTDFDSMNDAELARVANMILNDGVYGRIDFSYNGVGDEIDLTLVHENMVVDLDANINLKQNSLFIDTSYFTNLVRAVDITFYNVLFGDFKILRNGEECGDCNIVSFNSGELKFNTNSLSVSEASTFVVEEVVPDSPGGGPSGGGGGRNRISFFVDPNFTTLKIKPGESKALEMTVVNNGNVNLNIETSFSDIKERGLDVIPDSFNLNAGKFIEVVAIYSVGEREEPGQVIADEIVFSHRGVNNEKAQVILEIIDDSVLFDLESDLEDNFLWNYQSLIPKIKMTNLGGRGAVDVDLEYFVKDFNNKETKIGQETLTITEDETTAIPELPLLRYLRKGDYVFFVRLNYQDSYALASNPFGVRSFNIFLYLMVLIGVLGLVSGVLWYYDNDLRRFKRIVELGEHYLKGKDSKNASGKYRRMKWRFNYMNQFQRPLAKKEGIGFYVKLKTFIKNR